MKGFIGLLAFWMLFVSPSAFSQVVQYAETESEALTASNFNIINDSSVFDIYGEWPGRSGYMLLSEMPVVTPCDEPEGVLALDSIHNKVKVSINEDIYYSSAFTCTLYFKIKTLSLESSLEEISFIAVPISYEPGEPVFLDQSVYLFRNKHKVTLFVDSVVTDDGQQVNSLYSNIEIVQSYQIYHTPCLDTSAPGGVSVELSTCNIAVSWAPGDGAAFYELEFGWIDNYNRDVTTLKANFLRNSTRVQVRNKTSYTISRVREQGYLFARVRSVGVQIVDGEQQLIYGNWSAVDEGALTALIPNDNAIQLSPHSGDTLNWSYESVYAEWGKKKETVRYFDGSNRPQQELVKLNTGNKEVIISETVYDELGRAAVTILPVPGFDECLQYHEQFNKNLMGEEVAYENFLSRDDSCNLRPFSPLDDQFGASRYYSPNNDIDQGYAPGDLDALLPDADSFVFARTTFEDDQTGRVKVQGGVGKELTTGSGHDTRYYYGNASEDELGRLFGVNVGEAPHYRKELVLDPNNQFTYTYKDKSGQVIATAVAGDASPYLRPLASEKTTQQSDFLLDDERFKNHSNRLEGSVLQFDFYLTVAKESDYSFSYSLENYPYSECLPEGVCYDCVYQFEFSIVDDCGRELVGGGEPFVDTINSINFSCESDTLYFNYPSSSSVTLPLKPGSYHITKQLTLLDTALSYYEGRYLMENVCLEPLPEIEIDPCSYDCAGCNEEVAILKGLKAANDPTVTDEMIAALEMQCRQVCVEQGDSIGPAIYPSPCEALYQQMKMDMAPGGQYGGKYLHLSIYEGKNILPNYMFYEWIMIPETYIDGYGFIHPNELSPAEFKKHYRDEWGDYLVQYHPEYCYYKFCLNNEPHNRFEQQILRTRDFVTARDRGFTNPLISGNMLDSFFVPGEPGELYKASMVQRFNNYHTISGINFSIKELAVATGPRCSQYKHDVIQLKACVYNNPFGDETTATQAELDREWQNFRGFYMQAKNEFLYLAQERYAVDSGCYSGCLDEEVIEVKTENNDNDNDGDMWDDSYYLTNNWWCNGIKEINKPGTENACIIQNSSRGICEQDVFTAFFHRFDPAEPYVVRRAPSYMMVGNINVKENSSGKGEEIKDTAEAAIDDHCAVTCGGFAERWVQDLYNCDVSAETIDLIKAGLIEVCKAGCDVDHPYGTQTLPAGATTLNGYNSFEDVFQTFIGSNMNEWCHPDLLQYPYYHDSPGYRGKASGGGASSRTATSCDCEEFQETLTSDFAPVCAEYSSQLLTFVDILSLLMTEGKFEQGQTVSMEYEPYQAPFYPMLGSRYANPYTGMEGIGVNYNIVDGLPSVGLGSPINIGIVEVPMIQGSQFELQLQGSNDTCSVTLTPDDKTITLSQIAFTHFGEPFIPDLEFADEELPVFKIKGYTSNGDSILLEGISSCWPVNRCPCMDVEASKEKLKAHYGNLYYLEEAVDDCFGRTDCIPIPCDRQRNDMIRVINELIAVGEIDATYNSAYDLGANWDWIYSSVLKPIIPMPFNGWEADAADSYYESNIPSDRENAIHFGVIGESDGFGGCSFSIDYYGEGTLSIHEISSLVPFPGEADTLAIKETSWGELIPTGLITCSAYLHDGSVVPVVVNQTCAGYTQTCQCVDSWLVDWTDSSMLCYDRTEPAIALRDVLDTLLRENLLVAGQTFDLMGFELYANSMLAHYTVSDQCSVSVQDTVMTLSIANDSCIVQLWDYMKLAQVDSFGTLYHPMDPTKFYDEAGYYYTFEVVAYIGDQTQTLQGFSSCFPIGRCEPNPVPQYAECPSCLTCNESQEAFAGFKAEWPSLTPASSNYYPLLTSFLNRRLRLEFSQNDYIEFFDNCGLSYIEPVPQTFCTYQIPLSGSDGWRSTLYDSLDVYQTSTYGGLSYQIRTLNGDSFVCVQAEFLPNSTRYNLELALVQATGGMASFDASTGDFFRVEYQSATSTTFPTDLQGDLNALLSPYGAAAGCTWDNETVRQGTETFYASWVSCTLSGLQARERSKLMDDLHALMEQDGRARLHVLVEQPLEDPGCDLEAYTITTNNSVPLDTCACNDLLYTRWLTQHVYEGLDTVTYLAALTGVQLVEPDFPPFTTLTNSCQSAYGRPFSPDTAFAGGWSSAAIAALEVSGLTVPVELGCATCLSCDKAQRLVAQMALGMSPYQFENLTPEVLEGMMAREYDLAVDFLPAEEVDEEACTSCGDQPVAYACHTDTTRAWQLQELLNLSASLFGGAADYLLLNETFGFSRFYGAGTPCRPYLHYNTIGRSPNISHILKIRDFCGYSEQVTLTFPTEFADGVVIEQFSALTVTGSSGYHFEVVYHLVDGTSDTATGYLQSQPLRNCCPIAPLTLCPEDMEFPEVEWDDCEDQMRELNDYYTHTLYKDYLDSVRQAFRVGYTAHCLTNKVEQLQMDYVAQNHHYTLYYYDQAGNLVRTVPPAGVRPLNVEHPLVKDSLTRYMDGDTNYYAAPRHTMATTYRYNSLGQVVWQETPDGGITEFWYDAIGRLIVSRNAQQALDGALSYTRYDAHGRIVEVGQVDSNGFSGIAAIAHNFLDYASYLSWLGGNTKEQITKTYYDWPLSTTVNDYFGSEGQQHLLGRVSTVTYQDHQGPEYQSATHYSYDEHGNVNVLLQENTELEELGHPLKRIEYDYDLISGNVKQVSYQPGRPDQYYHRYRYDADNRLERVETSRDGVIWEEDATYSYYRHGPLARIELGEEKVQGLDYYYTLQGWLKGVNSPVLNPEFDPMKDGTDEVDGATLTRDAYGFNLHYYDGDYRSVNPQRDDYHTDLTGVTNAGTAKEDLFNGNISAMTTGIEPFRAEGPQTGFYRYDQLNRLVEASFGRSIDTATNTYDNSIGLKDEYHTEYSYDGNGNLLTLHRKGAAAMSLGMDELDYHYISGTNKLEYVDDAIPAAAYAEDIDDQATGNYTYDAIGNLTGDAAEEIAAIDWTVYGKVASVERTAMSDKATLEFTYGPDGNRLRKLVKLGDNPLNWRWTYYVRDAQGNVMATYTKAYEDSVQIDSEMYGWLIDSLLTQITVAEYAEFFSQYYQQGEVIQALHDRLAANGQLDGVVRPFGLDFYSQSPDFQLALLQTIPQDTLIERVAQYDISRLEFVFWLKVDRNTGHSMFPYYALRYDCVTYLTALAGIDPGIVEDLFTTMFPPGHPVPPTVQDMIHELCNTHHPQDIWSTLMDLHPDLALEAALDLPWQTFVAILDLFYTADGDETIKYTLLNDAAGIWALLDLNRPGTLNYWYSQMSAETLYNYLIDLDPVGFIEEAVKADYTATIPGLQSVEPEGRNFLKKIKEHFGITVYEYLRDKFPYEDFVERFKLAEWMLYGSERLGVYNADTTLIAKRFKGGLEGEGAAMDTVYWVNQLTVDSTHFFRHRGRKQFELKNHLGNVLAVVSDKKNAVQHPVYADSVAYFTSDILSAQDYYAFGMVMPSRTMTNMLEGYRFGFNGKEQDPNWNGTGTMYDYGFRIYDPRSGRFLSVDPLFKDFAWNSTYAYAENDVIRAIDLDGAEKKISIRAERKDGTLELVTEYDLEKQTEGGFGSLGHGTLILTQFQNRSLTRVEYRNFANHGSPGEVSSFSYTAETSSIPKLWDYNDKLPAEWTWESDVQAGWKSSDKVKVLGFGGQLTYGAASHLFYSKITSEGVENAVYKETKATVGYGVLNWGVSGSANLDGDVEFGANLLLWKNQNKFNPLTESFSATNDLTLFDIEEVKGIGGSLKLNYNPSKKFREMYNNMQLEKLIPDNASK